ncbi:hypothetical protein [Lactobacillus gasseri]|uniref:hypothetical protein n=1 Tax=Lactobacillus gasseri TaxID=1596 RepID=UPI00148562B2|nr:hypothetical protein [Lactobacillus gasseri]
MAEFDKTEVGEIKATVKVEEPKFTKKALISSDKFTIIERDILKLVLDDEKEYTIAEVQKAVQNFKEGY